MIDFVKIWICGELARAIRQNRALNWNIPVDENTGEVGIGAWAILGTMKIKVKGPARIEISGSLHHYWSDCQGRGKVNWDRFSFSDLANAIDSLCSRLNLPPEQLPLVSLEYGLNIYNPPFDISSVIDRFCYLYTRRFSEYPSDFGKAADTEQFVLKVYHKGKQAKIDYQIFRIELKIKKMQWLQSRGIKIETLADFLRLESLQALQIELASRLRAATVHEPNAPTKGMDKAQREFWKNAENPNWWKWLSRKDLEDANRQHKAMKKAFCKTSTNETIASLMSVEFALLSGTKVSDSRKSYRVGISSQAKILPTGKAPATKNFSVLKAGFGGKSYHLDEGYHFTPLPELDVDQDQQQVEADSEARPLPTCKVCLNPIEGRGKGAATCSQQCKSQADAKAKRAKRRAGKYGNEPGRLFRDSA